MGKGLILSHIADGEYNIRLLYDNTKATARLSVIDLSIANIISELPSMESERLDAYNLMFDKQNEINTYIATYRGTEDFNPTTVQKLNGEFLRLRIDYELKDRKYRILLLRKESLENEKLKLETKSKDYDDITAWCADLTTDLSGTIGTIEIGLEKDKGIIVLPGHTNAGTYQAIYDEIRDGVLTTFFNQTSYQIYTNRAWLPGLSKWQPRYRTGIINSLSGNICDINLDAFVSSQQDININQTTTLTNVPIVYMTCNGSAFTVGDHVVIGFDNSDWNNPVVIGFVENPRTCPPIGASIEFTVYGKFSTTVTTVGISEIVFGPSDYECSGTGLNYVTASTKYQIATIFEGDEIILAEAEFPTPNTFRAFVTASVGGDYDLTFITGSSVPSSIQFEKAPVSVAHRHLISPIIDCMGNVVVEDTYDAAKADSVEIVNINLTFDNVTVGGITYEFDYNHTANIVGYKEII